MQRIEDTQETSTIIKCGVNEGMIRSQYLTQDKVQMEAGNGAEIQH